MATATKSRRKAEQPKTRFTFRLLRGMHSEGIQAHSVKMDQLKAALNEERITEDEFNERSKNLRPRRVYQKGELIHTDKDLRKLNGPHPTMMKFALANDARYAHIADDQTSPKRREDALDAMSEDELRGLAEAEEIDISGCTDRASLVSTVRIGMGQ